MVTIHVIIPVYNAIKYLRDAVDSILNQPYKGISIVLVNDGSTDGSGALCDALAAENSRISVIHQKNAGVSAARNAGIEAVLETAGVADYIAFLDADDFWCPNAFSESAFGAPPSPSSNPLIARGTIICNQSATRFSANNQYSNARTQEGFRSIWNVGGHLGSCLYPVALFLNYSIRFIPGLRYAEDKIFQMQCVFLSANVQFLPTPLYVYRDNDTSAMKKLSGIPAIENYLPIIDGWISSDDFVNRYQPITGHELRAGRVLAGLFFLEMAAKHYKQWRPRAELMDVLLSHPRYDLVEQMRPQDVSVKQFQDRNLFLKHHRLFKLKYNLLGIIPAVGRMLLRVPLIAQWRSRKKYPLTELPVNQ